MPERSLEFSWYSVSSLSAYGRSVDCSSILTEWTQPNFEFSVISRVSWGPIICTSARWQWGDLNEKGEDKTCPYGWKTGTPGEATCLYISNHGYHGILSAGTDTDGGMVQPARCLPMPGRATRFSFSTCHVPWSACEMPMSLLTSSPLLRGRIGFSDTCLVELFSLSLTPLAYEPTYPRFIRVFGLRG